MRLHPSEEDGPALPSSITPTYLAEGAAHILYRLSQPPPSPSTDSHTDSFSRTTPPPSSISPPPSPPAPTLPTLSTHLLRLRKTSVPYPPVRESHRQFGTLVAPLLKPENLVQQTLVRLPDGFIRGLNTQLKSMEDKERRAQRRQGERLDEDEEMGLLVTNMTPNRVSGEVGVEFKVKWLVQSPTAPKDSTRCRTCALRAMRLSEGKEDHRPYCPLKLVSAERGLVEEAVRSFVHAGDATDVLVNRVADGLWQGDLLPRLRDLQRDMDQKGVLEGEVDEKFLIAMALRDCTLFLKIPANPTQPTEARLSDLDIKPASEKKLEHWRGTERRLIEEGWYEGAMTNDAGHNGCLLAIEKK